MPVVPVVHASPLQGKRVALASALTAAYDGALHHTCQAQAHPLTACPPPCRNNKTAEVHQILDLYRRVYEELLAVPVCKGAYP